ncbi:hypothetical protein QJS10_CPA03g01127 [Acorus calamus]|uniref:Uncharacterized protein n=1 Tax=Acorus calamus TaxID=4465 RepID=A0AAV9F6R4_ACOCL|nr:hypothetical protein QJS10_CPA03g01127 [Acorus calamus]
MGRETSGISDEKSRECDKLAYNTSHTSLRYLDRRDGSMYVQRPKATRGRGYGPQTMNTITVTRDSWGKLRRDIY